MKWDFQFSRNTQLKTLKKNNDLGYVGFFIDFIENSNYSSPFLPVPARVDKIFKNKPIYFIWPQKFPQIEINGEVYRYNAKRMFEGILENIIGYSIIAHRKISLRPMPLRWGYWWNLMKNVALRIPSIEEDIYMILSSYLQSYKEYREGDDLISSLDRYCDRVIDYLNSRIDSNQITVFYKKKSTVKKMYRERKGKIYPDIVECDYIQTNTGKSKRGPIIPIFFYDDLLECFIFNQNQLKKENHQTVVLDHYEKMLSLGYIYTASSTSEIESCFQELIQTYQVKSKK